MPPGLCVIVASRMVRRLLSLKSLASNIIVSTEWPPLPSLHPAQPLGERLWSHQEDLRRLDRGPKSFYEGNVLGFNRPLCIYFWIVNHSDYWKSVRNVEFNGGSAVYRSDTVM